MSSEIVLKRLSIAEMQPDPVSNIWAVSELNALPFAPGDTVSLCWVHLSVLAYLFQIKLKTLQNPDKNRPARKKQLESVRRHPLNNKLLLYGDFEREVVFSEPEALDEEE